MHRGERLRMPLVLDRAAWLERLCASGSGRVAHLGCADSPYTRELLEAGLLVHARLLRVADVTGFDVDGVAEAYSVTGEWDFVAILRLREPERLAQVVTGGISQLEGVVRTQTMVAFETFSKHDLEALFSIGQ